MPGSTIIEPYSDVGWVSAFTCPEGMRDAIVNELRYVQKRVCIAIYQIGDEAVGAELLALRAKAVEVKILVEGEPVGGRPSTEERLLEALHLAGCDVRLIESFEGYRRYDFLHCKYAVIDSRRVLLTSENWMADSLDDNRGWGVSVESPQIASWFEDLFNRDFNSSRLDIVPWTSNSSGEGRAFESLIAPEGPGHSYRANVEAICSPGGSEPEIISVIENATRRILVQQLSIEPKLASGRVVKALLDAAGRGVSVRVLLDGSYFSVGQAGTNDDVARALMAKAEALGLTQFRAATCTPYHDFSVIHNKGLVVDDTVLVSSINWGTGPFDRNRETGLVIESAELASFFASAFEEDWIPDSTAPTIVGVPESVTVDQGAHLSLNASASYDAAGIASFAWDLEGDGSIDWSGPRCYFALAPGPHKLLLTVTDTFGNTAHLWIKVEVDAAEQAGSAPWAVLAALAIGPIAWIARKTIKRR
ncbi:MAG TPA: phospholipase D-like domain-containing protein [Methanomassiliicoccales archaeon]|nr:phospholipase D-like domain-containing protein [Methanomassiliicoccales archaeon]